MSQDPNSASEISPNDPVGKVLGKEHPGRVRSLGMGAVPTAVFNQSAIRLGGRHSSSSVGESSQTIHELQNQVVSLSTQLKDTQTALLSYIQRKEGTIPDELAAILAQTSSQPGDVGSGLDSPANARRSSGGSNQR